MNELLKQLEELKAEQIPLEERLKELGELEQTLRIEISKAMQEVGSKKSITPQGKWQVILSTRSDIKVVDENTVKAFLQARGLLEECMRLDIVAVKKYGKAAEIPGMEETTKEIITVKSAVKEEKEVFYPEESQEDFRKRVRESKENN